MIETLYSWLIFTAVVGILTLGFGSLLDIIRGHDGQTTDAEPEAPPAAPEPEAPEPEAPEA